jgi:hypothetical protein
MRRISLSLTLLLIISCVGRAWADPLSDEMASINARWDTAINSASFDAFHPCIPLMRG